MKMRTLRMWPTPATCMVCILFGIICEIKEVCSQPTLIQRKDPQTPASESTLEEDIQKVINQIHSLSSKNTNARSASDPAGVDLNAYYSVISSLYHLLEPLLREKFLDDFPKLLVCTLSGAQDCGLEAQLVKAVGVEFGKSLLTGLSFLRSQTCVPLDEEPSSFLRSFLRMEESTKTTLNNVQEMFVNVLSHLPISVNLMNAVSGLVDAAVRYMSEFIATLIQVPMDYIRIALQFGIRVPSLEGEEVCEQGDLKQLIMWGLNHNVSWSFGASFIDILLDIFLSPEECTYPGPDCPNPSTIPFQRSSSEANDNIDTIHNNPLRCDHQNLARLNDTLCAEVMAGVRDTSSTSVGTLCQALNSLRPEQLQTVWRNMCYAAQMLMTPLLSRSSDCSTADVTPPSPFVGPPSETPAPFRSTSHRIGRREASNLQQLACNYDSWIQDSKVDPVLVSLCGDNKREEFVEEVCNNTALMKKLLRDKTNAWIYGYCANSSADTGYLLTQFCNYDQWMNQPTIPIGPFLLEFCMTLDNQRLNLLICDNNGFFMLLFSNPANQHLMPNCSAVLPPVLPPGNDANPLDPCVYSQWYDVTQISPNILSLCSEYDADGFKREVCSNQTFLNELLLNKENDWLQELCNSNSNNNNNNNSVVPTMFLQPTESPLTFNIEDWCDYHSWEKRKVDVSVVGLCWLHDQLSFQKNVCCDTSLFEKLLQDPQNDWLQSACADTEEIEGTEILPQVCKYTDWNQPIIVDMTELALCAESDPHNFTSKVCSNEKVLENLLANQDNTWLIQHCANFSKPDGDGDGDGGGNEGGGGSPAGFNPAEQCQYFGWSISHPDAALLTLCWEHDQANFVSSICPHPELLTTLGREPSSAWVSSMCTTYTNYTKTNPNPNNTTTTVPPFCLAKSLVKKFNWTCSADFSLACQPGASQNMALQMMVRCWLESLRSRVEDLLTPRVANVLDQAVSTSVVVLLILEEAQNTSLYVAQNIRQNILTSVVKYIKKETIFDRKRVLLQCFGRVLTSLMQTARDMTSDESIVIREFFNIPLHSLRFVLSQAHLATVRLILRFYNRNKNTLQLPDKYLSTMTSVLFQTHLVKDGSLFPELAPLLAVASPADIEALPSLQNNANVKETINRHLELMSLDQRDAFGFWFSKVMPPEVITGGQDSLIRDTGNLIAYLPFHNFQHLSSAQLLDGLDVLQKNTLSPLKQEFIANMLIGAHRNMTAEDFLRLGNISCLADPEDLLMYKDTEAFSVIQDIVINCTREGLSLPSHLLSSLLLDNSLLKDPASLTPQQLSKVAHLLPALGVNFLQDLTPTQLAAVLPALQTVTFSPAQASVIVEKLSAVMTLSAPGKLEELGSLVVGVQAEFFLSQTANKLLTSLPAMAERTPALSHVQCAALSTKLWGYLEVVHWLDYVEPLLYCTPLLSVQPRAPQLAYNISTTSTKHFNTQQAKAIFKQLRVLKPNLIKDDFQSLGTVGQGVSCKAIKERLQANLSPASVRKILAFLRQQPSLLHTSLKKCVVEEVYQYEFFPNILGDLGAELVLSMPVSIIKKFSVESINTLRKLIVQHPFHFLLLSRIKQDLLVDKIVQKMRMYTGVFTEEEFRLLGHMASFVPGEVFVQLDRRFFVENLNFLQELCYSGNKMDIVARFLQEPATFGPVKTWTKATLSQVDRFTFFLPLDKIQEIPRVLMTVGRIEKLFMSQQRWERGDVGSHCLDANERWKLFEKQQFLLQFFLGFLKIHHLSPTPMIPTCEILHTTAPSAWTPNSLTSMSASAFSNCLELMGQDQFMASYQRSQVLNRVKQMYGPVSSFSQLLISQLGALPVEMTYEELSGLRLTQRRAIAALGAIPSLTVRQLEALFAAVLNSTKQSPSQIDASTFEALGYIVCGAKVSEMSSFNAVEFSKAMLWLGLLDLKCSEDQMLVLVGLLSHSLAFGPISSWGTDVFIEIGILAAGLPDFAMSALVKEQIEGITPLAISKIVPEKFAVVFSAKQISMFSHDQAFAVTKEQILTLNYVQKTALDMVLTPWADKLVNFRGRSLGLALSPSPVCVILGLLMPLIILRCPGT